jgi:formylglycine-generating enzyme required for sulfatase activity
MSCTDANFFITMGSCVGDTTPVGSYESGKSPYGLYDMAGNVSEWVSSLYMPYPYDANDGREEVSSTDLRVQRGGAWFFSGSSIRSADRYGLKPMEKDAYNTIGFRCSRSP